MSALLVLLVLLFVALIAYVAEPFVSDHLRKRRTPVTMSPDWCAKCLRDLPVGEVYELQAGHQDGDGDGGTAGGTYLAQTFCRRHKPKGAKRA